MQNRQAAAPRFVRSRVGAGFYCKPQRPHLPQPNPSQAPQTHSPSLPSPPNTTPNAGLGSSSSMINLLCVCVCARVCALEGGFLIFPGPRGWRNQGDTGQDAYPPELSAQNAAHHLGCCAVLSRSVVSDSLQPHDCTPPGSSVHGILQARLLEWADMTSSRGSFPPRDRTLLS